MQFSIETIDKETTTKYVKPVSKSSPTIVSKLETLKISQKKVFYIQQQQPYNFLTV